MNIKKTLIVSKYALKTASKARLQYWEHLLENDPKYDLNPRLLLAIKQLLNSL